jgi:hypothetical protein
LCGICWEWSRLTGTIMSCEPGGSGVEMRYMMARRRMVNICAELIKNQYTLKVSYKYI